MKLKMHFQGLGMTDDDEAENYDPSQYKQMSRKEQLSSCYESSMFSVRRAIDLVKGGTLEFNENLCKLLSDELFKTHTFLGRNSIHLASSEAVVCKRRRVALVQLHYVIKQAETLVQMCCKSPDSLWPERAFLLLAIKEYVRDIICHLRWWTSILDMVIDQSTQETSYPERVEAEFIESLERADQDFERNFCGTRTHKEAALKDTNSMLKKVEEFQRSYSGHKHGIREHRAYLLSIGIHSLLTDNEEIKIPELDEFQVREVLWRGWSGVVSRVECCGFHCALKTAQISDRESQEREGRIHKSFYHPHIVQFFRQIWAESETDLETELRPAKTHVVMERMSADLGNYIRSAMEEKKHSHLRNTVGSDGKPEQTPESPFSYPVAIDIMLQVAKAARHMHSKNVVHRDLTTSNIFVRPLREDEAPELSAQGFLQVKVGDFGLARDHVKSLNEEPMTPSVGFPIGFQDSSAGASNKIKYPHKCDSVTFGIMCAEIFADDDIPNLMQIFCERMGEICWRSARGHGCQKIVQTI